MADGIVIALLIVFIGFALYRQLRKTSTGSGCNCGSGACSDMSKCKGKYN